MVKGGDEKIGKKKEGTSPSPKALKVEDKSKKRAKKDKESKKGRVQNTSDEDREKSGKKEEISDEVVKEVKNVGKKSIFVVRREREMSEEKKIEENEEEDRVHQLLHAATLRQQSVWDTLCKEIEGEMSEMDLVLNKLGLEPCNYRKDKNFQFTSYDIFHPPHPKECFSKDYLEYYIFPLVLPALESLIKYCRNAHVFESKVSLFNPVDYLTEYLFNNNPKYPHRLSSPSSLNEIPFTHKWMARYPRAPYPKWALMTEEEGAKIIQRYFRGYLGRKRVSQIRAQKNSSTTQHIKKSKEYRGESSGESSSSSTKYPVLFSPYYDEIMGEDELFSENQKTHSYDCFLCHRLRLFLERENQKTILLTPPDEPTTQSID